MVQAWVRALLLDLYRIVKRPDLRKGLGPFNEAAVVSWCLDRRPESGICMLLFKSQGVTFEGRKLFGDPSREGCWHGTGLGWSHKKSTMQAKEMQLGSVVNWRDRKYQSRQLMKRSSLQRKSEWAFGWDEHECMEGWPNAVKCDGFFFNFSLPLWLDAAW